MKKHLIVARVVVTVISILVGVLLLVLGGILTPDTVANIIKWGLIIYGILIIIGNVPGLISGIANVQKPAGVFDLICSILGVGLGVALIFYQGSILVALVAIYLIVFPLIRVLMASKKVEQLKRELLRIVLGVLLLVFVPNWTEAISNILQILFFVCGGAVILLSLTFGIIEIVRVAMAKEIDAPENGHIYVDFEEKND
jgi:hypothetical protein